MDFGPVGVTVQKSRLSRANSSMLSQLSFESGLTERLTDFTDRWSENSASRLPSPSPSPSPLVDRRLCQAVEAFEGAFEGEAPAGHAQQDNHSSSTSSEPLQPATTTALQICTTKALQIRPGKRKAVACNDSTMPTPTSSGKCVSAILVETPQISRVQISEANKSSHAKSGQEGKSTSAGELTTTSELVHSRGSSASPKCLKASSKLQLELPDPKQDYIHPKQDSIHPKQDSIHPKQDSIHPKLDFIHVRARRGQATDSHSLAERVRREKISERMKFLQDLVPGCSKVTGKAVMLDEIINYVQSLQRQIEFLSMKLAAVDPQLDVNLEILLNKETRELHAGQARSPETTLLGPDPAAGYREFQAQLQLLQQINSCNVMDMRSSVNNNYAPVQLLPPLPYSSEGFVDPFSQTLNGLGCDGDLQTIVHMANSQAGRSEFLCQDQFHGPGFFSPGFLKVEY